MSETCVFSVIFPGNIPFFNNFLESLEKQDFKDFDVILINDGVDEPELYNHINNFAGKLNIKVYYFTGPIPLIRSYGISILLRSDYKKIIFADSDDLLSENRIRVCNYYLDYYPLVVNDITLFQQNDEIKNILVHSYFVSRLENKQIFDISCLYKSNFVGLTNSAIRKDLLISIQIPFEIIAVDWFIFTSLLLTGKKGVFTSETQSFYRQYSNSIGELSLTSEEKVRHGLEVKKAHYKYLQYLLPVYSLEYQNILKVETYINASSENIIRYIESIKGLRVSHPLWWEQIFTLDQF